MAGAIAKAQGLIGEGFELAAKAGAAYYGATGAIAAIQQAIPAITQALQQAVSTGAQIASALGSAATVAIPVVGVVIAITTRILLGLRAQRRSAQARKECRRAAMLYAVDLAIQRNAGTALLSLNEIPTSTWAPCWHRGLRTSNRKNGRMSTEILQGLKATVLRRDVLPSAGAYTGRVYGVQGLKNEADWPPRGPIIAPWMGPFAFIDSPVPSRSLLEELAPEGLAACLALAESLLQVRVPALALAAAAQIRRLQSMGTSELPSSGSLITTPTGNELAALLRGYIA